MKRSSSRVLSLPEISNEEYFDIFKKIFNKDLVSGDRPKLPTRLIDTQQKKINPRYKDTNRSIQKLKLSEKEIDPYLNRSVLLVL